MMNKSSIALLVACALFILCCKKSKPSPLSYARKMEGLHHWTGTFFRSTKDRNDSTAPVSMDFSIKFISDTTLIETLDNLTLQYTRANDSLLFFEFNDENYPYSSDTLNSCEIIYSFRDNKIYFYRTSSHYPLWDYGVELVNDN